MRGACRGWVKAWLGADRVSRHWFWLGEWFEAGLVMARWVLVAWLWLGPVAQLVRAHA